MKKAGGLRPINRNNKTFRVSKKGAHLLGFKIPLFMLPILVIFGLATIFLTIEAATSGAKLANLEQKANLLARDNENLEQQLVTSSSLTDLGKKADELGFAKPQSVLYISNQEAVAKLP